MKFVRSKRLVYLQRNEQSFEYIGANPGSLSH